MKRMQIKRGGHSRGRSECRLREEGETAGEANADRERRVTQQAKRMQIESRDHSRRSECRLREEGATAGEANADRERRVPQQGAKRMQIERGG